MKKLSMAYAALAMAAGVFLIVTSAGAAGGTAFPWSGDVVLNGAGGKKLGWTVTHGAGKVTIGGKSPVWTVVHEARPDGTPIKTTKHKAGHTSTVLYKPGGATYTYTEGGSTETTEIRESGLWDGDALEVRFAGIDWTRTPKFNFKIIDTDSDDGTVYEMAAKNLGVEACGATTCHHIKVNLAGIKASFGPKWHFWFGTGPGAPYIKFQGPIGTFTAP